MLNAFTHGHLDADTFYLVAPELELLPLDAGQQLCGEGDPADAMFLVLRGTLDVLVHGPDGAERHVHTLGRGDNVGEMALLSGRARSATLRARTATRVLRISRRGFDLLVARHPPFVLSLARQLADRLESLSATVAAQPAGGASPARRRS